MREKERKENELEEEFVGELEELPVWIQEGDLGIQSVEFEVLRGGQRTKQNVAEHAEAVFQGAQSAE